MGKKCGSYHNKIYEIFSSEWIKANIGFNTCLIDCMKAIIDNISKYRLFIMVINA